MDVELSEPLQSISAQSADGSGAYPRALCLIRLHGVPLGLIDLDLASPASPFNGDGPAPGDGGSITPEQLARRVWEHLGPEIRDHLRADGLPLPQSILPGGLPVPNGTACGAEREAVRASGRPVSIVVATRDRPASLGTCLRSLVDLDYPDYEIVVVDNAPNGDETRQLVTGREFAGRVQYLREDRRGLAAAHNRGLASVAGEIVAFTDDDVVADQLWLLELVRGFRLAEGVACVTGLIVPAELETEAQLVAERLWGFNKGFAARVFDGTTHGGDPLYPYAAGKFGSGANMAFATAELRARGGFDPRIGIGTPARGGDDLSAFFTVIASGHRLVYNPGAVVRHRHHAEYGALRRQAFNYGVGLTAYLTKTVADDPGRLLKLVRLGHMGFRRALDPRPGAVSREERDWPSALARLERLGMIQGPGAYLWSRLQAARPTARDR
ncbi:MAG: glycosyltransferase [Actinomycetota bacterium]|nr:glycosyltransferase [Actinomycetota bacterium]